MHYRRWFCGNSQVRYLSDMDAIMPDIGIIFVVLREIIFLARHVKTASHHLIVLLEIWQSANSTTMMCMFAGYLPHFLHLSITFVGGMGMNALLIPRMMPYTALFHAHGRSSTPRGDAHIVNSSFSARWLRVPGDQMSLKMPSTIKGAAIPTLACVQ
jgi:hypothetical protein